MADRFSGRFYVPMAMRVGIKYPDPGYSVLGIYYPP